MATQKELIDTGTPGDETSGDTLNAGGQKINSNIDSIWETLSGSDGNLVGTGPYKTSIDSPLVRNRKYEANTSGGALSLSLSPASDGIYKTGDVIVLRDSRGTWGTATTAVSVQSDDGSIDSMNSIVLDVPNTEVVLTCVDGSANTWVSRTTSIKGNQFSLVDLNQIVTPSNSLLESLYNIDKYHAMKIMVVASNNVTPSEKSVSEILITDDGTEPLFTEYAVINTSSSGDPLINLDFDLSASTISVQASVASGFSSVAVQISDIQRIEKLN